VVRFTGDFSEANPAYVRNLDLIPGFIGDLSAHRIFAIISPHGHPYNLKILRQRWPTVHSLERAVAFSRVQLAVATLLLQFGLGFALSNRATLLIDRRLTAQLAVCPRRF
jgi:hypothetical protein